MTPEPVPKALVGGRMANYRQADQNIATERGHLIPLSRP